MMRGLVDTLQNHHRVKISDDTVAESVRLSHRDISGRQLPDKSACLLDTICARVANGHSATPPSVKDCQYEVDQLSTAIDILKRKMGAGSDHVERTSRLTAQRDDAIEWHERLTAHWESERILVRRIHEICTQLSSAPGTPVPQADSGGDQPTAEEEEASAAQPLYDGEREQLHWELRNR